MIHPKVIIFMPAYNAEKTVGEVWEKIPWKYKKNTFLIDDHSKDNTYTIAKKLDITSYYNRSNLGYGGNLKMGLRKSLDTGADIIVEMHPDNEYDPASIDPAIQTIMEKTGMILGNRINPVATGMYLWKYIPTKLLTAFDNLILGTQLSDLHQGFRVYTRQMLEIIPFEKNANDYLFSFEIIAQTIFYGFTIQEVSVKTNYTGKKRGASLKNSIAYTLDTFSVLKQYILAKAGIAQKLFPPVAS